MLLQNYKEDIERNLSGSATHNYFCDFLFYAIEKSNFIFRSSTKNVETTRIAVLTQVLLPSGEGSF